MRFFCEFRIDLRIYVKMNKLQFRRWLYLVIHIKKNAWILWRRLLRTFLKNLFDVLKSKNGKILIRAKKSPRIVWIFPIPTNCLKSQFKPSITKTFIVNIRNKTEKIQYPLIIRKLYFQLIMIYACYICSQSHQIYHRLCSKYLWFRLLCFSACLS